MRLSPLEAATRWKKIKEFTNRITDQLLRESILAEYQQRAIDEWGFCPDSKEHKQTKVELDPWQEAFLAKIKSTVEYGVFVVDEQVAKEAKARMRMFIEKGGNYSDLPKDLQNKHISVLYIETLVEMIKENEKELENLNKNT